MVDKNLPINNVSLLELEDLIYWAHNFVKHYINKQIFELNLIEL